MALPLQSQCPCLAGSISNWPAALPVLAESRRGLRKACGRTRLHLWVTDARGCSTEATLASVRVDRVHCWAMGHTRVSLSSTGGGGDARPCPWTPSRGSQDPAAKLGGRSCPRGAVPEKSAHPVAAGASEAVQPFPDPSPSTLSGTRCVQRPPRCAPQASPLPFQAPRPGTAPGHPTPERRQRRREPGATWGSPSSCCVPRPLTHGWKEAEDGHRLQAQATTRACSTQAGSHPLPLPPALRSRPEAGAFATSGSILHALPASSGGPGSPVLRQSSVYTSTSKTCAPLGCGSAGPGAKGASQLLPPGSC